MRIEWRRDDEPPGAGEATAASAALAQAIRDEITARGPITFARFMERALYDSALGYYATSSGRPTRAGDFLTAPELHPIFGRTLAVQIDEMWRRLGGPADFTVLEYGAGSGALMLAVLDGLRCIGSPIANTVRYDPIDFARQRSLIQARMTDAGHAEQLVRAADDHHVRAGVALANEFLDALPVHRVISLKGELREVHVDWRDDAFVEVAGPLTNDHLATWFEDAGVELADGQRAEVNLAMLKWLRTLNRQLDKGYAIVIDYGAGAAQLYDDSRPNGTVRAFSENRVSSDVLSEPGSRDITSNVDFDAFERHASLNGFEILGRRRSNELLLACGLDDAYAQARAETQEDWDAALNLRSAVGRLLDPNALGGYLVAVLARQAPTGPPLLGLRPLPSRA